MSIREIAKKLKRPATALYHHIEILESAGLIAVTEIRPGTRRSEKVYALTSRQLTSRKAAQTKAGREALSEVSRRFLANATRSLEASLRSGQAVTAGVARDTAIQHVQVRLDRRALARLNTEINALLQKAQAQSKPTGKGISLTIALSPTE